MRILRILKNS